MKKEPNRRPTIKKADRELSEKELRKLAHDRVWGGTAGEFAPLESVLPKKGGDSEADSST